jgi:hypothetical protein
MYVLIQFIGHELHLAGSQCRRTRVQIRNRPPTAPESVYGR